MIKQIFMFFLIAIVCNNITAQNKIGFVYSDSVISQMPETAMANICLKKFQDSLGIEYDKLQQKADSLSSSFIRCIDHMQPDTSHRVLNRNKIIELFQQIQNFNQFAQNLCKQKSKELSIPIHNKCKAVVKQVAEENGYSYVLDFSDEHLQFLPLPPYDDITNLVLRKLDL